MWHPCAATAALETLQQLVKEQNAALGKLKVQAQEQAANARRLQERYDTADRFAQMLRCETNCVKDRPCSAGCVSSILSNRWMLMNELRTRWKMLLRAAVLQTHQMHIDKMSLLLLICRQQLERSESLRVAGQRALAELKAEFEALTGELVAEGQLSGGDAAAAVAHPASLAADQQQRGPSGELGQHAGRVLFRWIIRLACRRQRLGCAQLSD